MGLLDFLTGNNAGASPYGALYPTVDPNDARAKAAADLLASMGVSSTNLPQISAFDLPQPQSAAPAPAPAAPSFGQGATPFGFAGPGSMSGVNPSTFAPPAAPAPQAASAPTPTDLSSVNRPAPPQDQADPLAVGNYQMPRVGSADSFEPDDAVPANAKATQGVAPGAPPQAAPFSLGGTSSGVGDRLGMAARGFLGNLSAGPIGALMAGTGSLLMGRESDPTAIHSQQMNATGQALVAKGAPVADVRAAINNPALMTALVGQYYGKDKYQFVKTKDAFGGEQGRVFNQADGTFKDVPASGNAGAAPSSGGFLAPGVTYDPNKTGDDYFAQFSPEVQAAAKAYMAGDVMPTGNARMGSIATFAKTVAQKYGQDTGIPVSDSLYSEKRRYRTDLGSTTPNSTGGQAKAFVQGTGHLLDLANVLEKLDNSNGLGIPMIAQGVNSVRQGMSNEQSALSDEAKSLGQTVAGEVGKLFSGQAGGGVHERELTRERFDTVKSRPQLAAALRATVETMQGGLTALEQTRDRVLGPNSGVDFVGDTTRQKIAQIQGVIDRLDGKGGAAAPAAAPGGLPSGWSVKVR